MATVLNQQVVKDQLKQAKKAQQKQEAATKGLQAQQTKQYEALAKQQASALDKARKTDAAAVKATVDRANAELATLRKAESNATKTLDKALKTDDADLKKRIGAHKTGVTKLLKDLQARETKTTFANQKKEQLKAKATKKAVTALHKDQDKDWNALMDSCTGRVNNLMQAQQVELELIFADFQQRRIKDSASGWAHLVHLREVQLVQRRGLQQLEALMRDQSIELEYHQQLQALELEHVKSLHALREEQTRSGAELELRNHKESAEAEFKRLLRVHKNDAKNALKEWSKNSKNTLKRAKGDEAKQAKQRTAVEEEKMRTQQRVEEEKFTAGVRAQMEKDEKALLEYQRDSEARLKEFQTRDLAKREKEAAKRTEELLAAQSTARAQLRKRVTVEALTLIFQHSKQELESLKQMQSDEMIQQTNMRNVRKTSRASSGLPEAPEDDGWQQKLMDRHYKVQEELLSEQKAQFHEVYGAKDELAEAIWSWRNADDLQNKLDEVVPSVSGPLESPEDVAKEATELAQKQDHYRDLQEKRIAQLDDAIRMSQQQTLDETLATAKRECDELIEKQTQECAAKLAEFNAACAAAQ